LRPYNFERTFLAKTIVYSIPHDKELLTNKTSTKERKIIIHHHSRRHCCYCATATAIATSTAAAATITRSCAANAIHAITYRHHHYCSF